MLGDCPASLHLLLFVVRLWKTFGSKPNAIPPGDKNCSPSQRNRRSPSDRNAVRNHNGIVFGFRPESRSPSTGFPTLQEVRSPWRADMLSMDLRQGTVIPIRQLSHFTTVVELQRGRANP